MDVRRDRVRIAEELLCSQQLTQVDHVPPSCPNEDWPDWPRLARLAHGHALCTSEANAHVYVEPLEIADVKGAATHMPICSALFDSALTIDCTHPSELILEWKPYVNWLRVCMHTCRERE